VGQKRREKCPRPREVIVGLESPRTCNENLAYIPSASYTTTNKGPTIDLALNVSGFSDFADKDEQ